MSTKTKTNGRICPARPRVRRRAALYLDLENLLYDPIALGDIDRAFADLRAGFASVARTATVVTAVASVNHFLWQAIAFDVDALGVRVHCHCGGPDAADHDLLDRMQHQLPASVDTVVIGSGDHIFAPAALALRARGLRVEVLARRGNLARELYLATQDYHVLGMAGD